MPKKEVIILRGLPGSGKSSYVIDQYYAGGWRGDAVVHCSADSFFYKEVSEKLSVEPYSPVMRQHLKYEFNTALLPQAHTVCLGVFIKSLQDDCETIIVDNTNTQLWEYRNYVELAELSGYEVKVRSLPLPETRIQLKVLFDRQVHRVPLEAFLRMWWRWELDPRESFITLKDPSND